MRMFNHKILVLASMLLLALVAAGCPEVGGDQEGNVNSGSLLVVTDFQGGGYCDVYDAGSGNAVLDGINIDFTLENQPMYDGQDPSTMATIFLQSYTVSYKPMNSGAPALQDREVSMPNAIILPYDTFNGTNWPIVAGPTILEYGNALGWTFTGIDQYNCEVIFKGETEYGYEVKARTNVIVYMGDF